ncbi:hypothetical protein GCM10023161_42120 [Mycobacterium paraffinicum]|uniref:Transposase n=1 Tax=Mycobacterium paraffinicum TaxID=53378 RepID=A0ABP8F2U8_9MYCO
MDVGALILCGLSVFHGEQVRTESRAEAVRLVLEHADYASEWATITAVSKRWGMTAETLRSWICQQQVTTLVPSRSACYCANYGLLVCSVETHERVFGNRLPPQLSVAPKQ